MLVKALVVGSVIVIVTMCVMFVAYYVTKNSETQRRLNDIRYLDNQYKKYVRKGSKAFRRNKTAIGLLHTAEADRYKSLLDRLMDAKSLNQ